jgi:hypothetical protein
VGSNAEGIAIAALALALIIAIAAALVACVVGCVMFSRNSYSTVK